MLVNMVRSTLTTVYVSEVLESSLATAAVSSHMSTAWLILDTIRRYLNYLGGSKERVNNTANEKQLVVINVKRT